MKEIKLSGNLVYLRKKRGITQEELAEFLGVTKASVSKWENGLSMPDILTLPKLAAYFDVSIDELMGYQAQLTEKEIQKVYQQFAEAFSGEPFEQVTERIREFVREYFSCYPALLQMTVLYMNYYMQAETKERQRSILEEVRDLCVHIEAHCADKGIVQDAMVMRSMCMLAMGEPEVAIQNLEEYYNPRRLLGQSEGLLIQAYQMTGQQERAEECSQYLVFKNLMGLIGDSFSFVLYHMQDWERGIKTIERLRQVMEVYEVEQLHPNGYVQYEYLCAQFYAVHGRQKEALECLKKYAKVCVAFVNQGVTLHGDAYFDKLGEYYRTCGIENAPRDNKSILDSAEAALEHPMFEPLKDTGEFQKIKKIFTDNK